MTTDTNVAETVTSSESRNWAVASHLSALLMFAGIPSPLGPLGIWLFKKDDPHVTQQAVAALNFNLSFLIYAIVAGLSIILLVGIILLPIVMLVWFVLVIVASIKAANDEPFDYPFTIDFIQP